MRLRAYFSENGIPKPGLYPRVTVYNLTDNSKDVDAQIMTEGGVDGFYYYDFTAFDATKRYDFLCDSVTLVGNERYAIGSVETTTDQIIASISDGSLDLQEMLRVIVAQLVGKASGGGTTTITFRDTADTKNRIVMAVNNVGDRSSVVLDGS